MLVQESYTWQNVRLGGGLSRPVSFLDKVRFTANYTRWMHKELENDVPATAFDNRVFNISVRYPEEHRRSTEDLGALLVDVPGGFRVPLRDLADVDMTEGPVQISRENGQRRIGIELNVSGRDIGGFVREAQRRLREQVSLPAGYHITWGGQFENQQQAMRRLETSRTISARIG